MKTYESMTSGTQESREKLLKTSTEKTGNGKKEIAKLLVAMITAGDCKPGKILEHAKSITGKDLRTNFQGVYELMSVFQAIIEKKIDMTEEEFDKLESSKIALLSPFLNKENLKEKLGEALQAVKDGKTAKEIRELKGKSEPKPSKKVLELEAEIERLKAENLKSGVIIESALVVTDISANAPILTSQQVKNRIRKDIETNTENQESLLSMVEVLGKALVMACVHAEVDAQEWLAEIYSDLAKKAEGQEVQPLEAIAA